MTEKVKCVECENLILPRTAANNGGLCAACVDCPPEFLVKRRDFNRRLREGLVFRPSEDELASATTPAELVAPDVQWTLHPEYYEESKHVSAVAAILSSSKEPMGDIFLVSSQGGELTLGFTDSFAVLEYQNSGLDELRWAHSNANITNQVPNELHVGQACSCCGVGLHWYPSRFHMPRERAFVIFEDIVTHRSVEGISWLVMGDISYTGQGGG